MFEKVNPAHPDKVADRIAGAIVDMAYEIQENPKIAVEVLLGHGECMILIESSVSDDMAFLDIKNIVKRIAGANINVKVKKVAQDIHLAQNQRVQFRCGDNGIFKGVPLSGDERLLSHIARDIYNQYPTDGKYIITADKLIICQSNADDYELEEDFAGTRPNIVINPLGGWSGGIDVDSGATNRKLGSDMARSVTGGGLHGKDLSKADVSVNIYAFLKAQKLGKEVELSCAIGDTEIDGKPYAEIVEIARKFIKEMGGFEKFAEWGLF